MHFRGKRMRFYAEYPDGSSEELINIANYNYNWQLAYTYEEPKFVPAGTVITATGAFDNSTQNKMNPDPYRSVPCRSDPQLQILKYSCALVAHLGSPGYRIYR